MITSSSFLSLSGSQWLHLKMQTLLGLIYHVSSVWNLSVSSSDFWSLVLDSLCILASCSHPFSFVSLTSWMMKAFSSPAEISFHLPFWGMVHIGVSQSIKSELKWPLQRQRCMYPATGFRLKVVGTGAVELEGSSPCRCVSQLEMVSSYVVRQLAVCSGCF